MTRRPRLDPATAGIRNAVRDVLDSAGPAPRGSQHAAAGSQRVERTYVVAVSGGADSLALATAAAFLHSRGEGRFLACTVDHGLQEGSAEVADHVVSLLESLGLPARRVTADVDLTHPGGLEAAARSARYAALARVAHDRAIQDDVVMPADVAIRSGAAGRPHVPVVLTGHTRDDQAETVLLGLLRGSGARSLSGMAPRTHLETVAGTVEVVRPLLHVTREDTRASCHAQNLHVWDDPMNEDPRFSRIRARTTLQTLSDALGQDLRAGLARTADLLRDDADHLDAEAAATWTRILASRQAGFDEASPRSAEHTTGSAPESLEISALAPLSSAVRNRVLRTWLRARGVRGSDLTADHVRGVWEVAAASGAGVREVSVPGGGTVRRTGGQLTHRRVTQ